MVREQLPTFFPASTDPGRDPVYREAERHKTFQPPLTDVRVVRFNIGMIIVEEMVTIPVGGPIVDTMVLLIKFCVIYFQNVNVSVRFF